MIRKTLIATMIAIFSLVSFADANMHDKKLKKKEKLYVVNSGSPGGSYNPQMMAYAEGLKKWYDTEYVQGNGCSKAFSVIGKASKKSGVYYIWGADDLSDFLNGLAPNCGKIPTKENFVNSTLKYGIIFTQKDGINREDFKKGNTTVCYNNDSSQIYLEALAKHEGITGWKLIRFKNSTGVVLGVMNKECAWGITISPGKYYGKTDKLRALYTLNPNGENGIPALKSATSFPRASDGGTDFFLAENTDPKLLRERVKELLNDPNSEISKYYKAARGYNNTHNLPLEEAVKATRTAVNNWSLKAKLKD